MRKFGWVAVLVLIGVVVLGLLMAGCGNSTTTTTTATPATTPETSPSTTTAPETTQTTAATSSTSTSAAAAGTFKVGIAISFTGEAAAPCVQVKEGFDSYAKYLNANGGIGGRQVELIYVDDQSKSDTSVAAVQSLMDKKVDVIIGPFSHGTSRPRVRLPKRSDTGTSRSARPALMSWTGRRSTPPPSRRPPLPMPKPMRSSRK